MYNSMYQALKAAILPVEGLSNVQWFNNQYEGVVGQTPVVYVEFNPLSINKLAKSVTQTEIGIRLHVVTANPGTEEGTIPDELVTDHHLLAGDVADAVESYRLPFEGEVTRPLQLTGWTALYKYNGWLVTQIDLRTKG